MRKESKALGHFATIWAKLIRSESAAQLDIREAGRNRNICSDSAYSFTEHDHEVKSDH